MTYDMTSRRHFLYTAAGAAAFSRMPELFAADTKAAKFDLIIKGGRVIDPSRKLDAVRDVAIAQGKIAAIRENIAAAGAETLDAKGKLVVPGLIDIHTHALRFSDGPKRCLADGVTGIIEAGSKGADGIDEMVAGAKAAPQQARILINIGRGGLLPEGDTMDIKRADVGLAKAAIERNREYVVGIKARLSKSVAGDNDFEVLRRATELASSFRIPVMIHMGQTVSPLSKLLPLMKSGDIVSHMYAPPPNSIVDDDGRIRPEVTEARKRGVFFDLGNGRSAHLRWDMADKIMKTGFMPDSFSTDWTMEDRKSVV
jgi:dihydroorotase